MPEKTPIPEQKKLPNDFNDKFNPLKQMKDDKSPMYYSVIRDIEVMAAGGDAGGIRQQYYPEWKDSDFQELLKKLGE